MSKPGPKILLLDVETAPMLAYVWGLFDITVGLDMVKEDWHVLSWSAKWLDEKKIMYADQRNTRDISNDKALLKGIWDLLDEADVIITQNGKKFDIKKLNARFIIHGMAPPSPVRHIDTLVLARKHFAFTSNKLAHLSSILCSKRKKSEHLKFPGFKLWEACLKGNQAAWREMEKYNKLDVLALEELYLKLAPWDNSAAGNLQTYQPDQIHKCTCGSKKLLKRGYSLTNTGKYQRLQCAKCGKWYKEGANLLDVQTRKKLLKST